MTVRSKWDITLDDDDRVFEKKINQSGIDRQTILELLDNDSFTTHFQPVFSAKDGSVYGYEALTRLKDKHNNKINVNSGELFKKAINTDTIFPLDYAARKTAVREAAALGIKENGSLLFINICPETLTDPSCRCGITDDIAESFGMPKERIVLKITEGASIINYDLFEKAVSHSKQSGYKIAIDDFGAGYGGLKMLSVIEPDFVKIDRHFVSSIDKATIKFNLVDSIASACHRLGIKVITDGIEREEELKVVINMGIDLLQGCYLCRPQLLLRTTPIEISALNYKKVNIYQYNKEPSLIGDIVDRIEPISPDAHITDAFNRFINNYKIRNLPVVADDRIVGILQRNRFLENNVLGKYGYGMYLNAAKRIKDLMEQPSMIAESNTTIEDAAQRLQMRQFEFIYDDICVTKTGKFYGMVPVNTLLEAITEKSLILAKGANPLTGLPGNEFIQREIEKKLSMTMHFDVCYIDLDNFKPYNDYYGFSRGDVVIKTLAEILVDNIAPYNDEFNFVGHIGGDDFIMLLRPRISMPVCEKVIADFESRLLEFHERDDYERGHYISKNRRGEEERCNLLSISIGIVNMETHKFASYAELASIATEVKKGAKMQSCSFGRSSILMDRRVNGH